MYYSQCSSERATRLELVTSAWEARMLPLHHARRLLVLFMVTLAFYSVKCDFESSTEMTG